MLEILIFLLAGIGAGIITGIVSASATNVVAPLLIVFLGIPAYSAIGISLLTDVFASSSSAFVYWRHKRLEILPSMVLLVPAIIFAIIGSYFSQFIPSGNLSGITGIGIALAGLSIIFRKDKNKNRANRKRRFIYPIFVGCLIGLVAGVFGGGGGMMILMALIFLLNYKIHNAIGTSVFIMIFIALFGGLVHYFYVPFNLTLGSVAFFGALISGYYTSKYANKINEKYLKILGGIIIMLLGITLSLKGFGILF
jgi:uncharacterized protein